MARVHWTWNGKLRLIAREEVDDAVTAKELERRRRVLYKKMTQDVEHALASLGYQASASMNDFSGPEMNIYFQGDRGGPEGLDYQKDWTNG